MRQARPTKGAAVITAAMRRKSGLFMRKDFMVATIRLGMAVNDDLASRLHSPGGSEATCCLQAGSAALADAAAWDAA